MVQQTLFKQTGIMEAHSRKALAHPQHGINSPFS
jgi:hypothetical protein